MSSLQAPDDPYYDARTALVTQINRDRAAAGAPPVEMDSLSSVVADRHCQEMAANRYLSHWNLKGLLPYHRYHFAGGRDHVQENLSRVTVFSNAPSPISTSPENIQRNLLQAEERFMAEKPPLDGHRKNVLDPAHTHVGVGLAVVGPEFTMSLQFLNRYVRLNDLPLTLPGKVVELDGEMLRKDFGPYFCVLFYEGPPVARTAKELERTYAYIESDGEECVTVPPWKMQFDRNRGRFRFRLPAKDCGPGYYHLLLWVRNNVRDIPYVLRMGANRVSTTGAVPAAGWVFYK